MWGAGKNGRALQVDLLSKASPGPWGDASASDCAYPVREDVAALIAYSLERGWAPDARGGTFVLTGSEHASLVILPDFVITDLL
jgi:hypothetical protein